MYAKIDRHLIRAAGHSRRYVLIQFTAPEVPDREGRTPANVSLVLDRSGSMSGNRIELARTATKQAIRLLRGADRFSVVAYDDRIDVLVESTPAEPESRERACRLVGGLEARNATDLSSGWLTGCEQVSSQLNETEVGKVLLLSDGKANRGITDVEELSRHALELRNRGVLTSTFGVGADFDERLLQTMATAGGGHFYFIEHPQQIPDYLTSELNETLEVVARDVEIVLTGSQGTRFELLHSFPSESEERRIRCRLGNLVSGELVMALFSETFPAGEAGAEAWVGVRVSDRDSILELPAETMVLQYAGHKENDEQPRDLEVDRVAAEIYAGRARLEALEANSQGRYAAAQQMLFEVAKRIETYAGSDPALRGLAGELREDASAHRQAMPSMESKSRSSRTASRLRNRQADGKARRGARLPDDAARFQLRMAAGHPVANIDGVHCLLETGSPVSFGRKPVRILGEKHVPAPGLGAVRIEEISRLIGHPVDVLLGTDLLARYRWLMNPREETVAFAHDTITLSGETVAAPMRFGVPCVEIECVAGSRLAFLDTGARLSYLDQADLGGLTPAGEEEDFFPAVGFFRVPVYEQQIRLGALPLRGRFGVLPDALFQVLSISGATWIVGSDLLGARMVLFDLAEGRIVVG